MSFAAVRLTLSQISQDLDLGLGLLSKLDLGIYIREALTAEKRWHRRDCPLKASLVVWLVIAMNLYRSLSIPDVFRALLANTGVLELGSRLVTPEALWRARERLGSKPLARVFEMMASALPAPPRTFAGMRVYAIDGCRLTVPDTPKNEAEFGRFRGSRGPAAYPQTLAVMLVDVWGHRVRAARFYGHNGAERAAVEPLIESLDKGDLIIVDRGFPSRDVFESCESKGVFYLARIASSWKLKTVKEYQRGDALVELQRDKNDRNSQPKQMRLVSYQVDRGETIRLLTNIPRDRCSGISLAQQYQLRWECELTYKEQKLYLAVVEHGKQFTVFRSKNPDSVLQEAWGLLIAHNLLRELMIEAAVKQSCGQVSPLHISYTATLRLVRIHLPQLLDPLGPTPDVTRRRLLQQVSIALIDRPRRARAYPRKVKRKMGNFHLKGSADTEHKPARALRLTSSQCTFAA